MVFLGELFKVFFDDIALVVDRQDDFFHAYFCQSLPSQQRITSIWFSTIGRFMNGRTDFGHEMVKGLNLVP